MLFIGFHERQKNIYSTCATHDNTRMGPLLPIVLVLISILRSGSKKNRFDLMAFTHVDAILRFIYLS